MAISSRKDSDLDPRCPEGMNYLDWLMMVLKPDEMTAKNRDEIVAQMRKLRVASDAGIKPKKGTAPKISLSDLKLAKPKPSLIRRLI